MNNKILNESIYKLRQSLEIGSGTKKYVIDYISSDVIILKTNIGALRYIPTELISVLLDKLEKEEISYKNIIDRKVGNKHIVDFLDINFDKFIFGYERNIHDLCHFCLESEGKKNKINKPKSFDSSKNIILQDKVIISNDQIKDFAFEVFSLFYGEKWDEIIDESKRKNSTINNEEYFVLDYNLFTRLLGEFSNSQDKDDLTSGNTLRFFPEPVFLSNGKYYYFTSQWYGKGNYTTTYENLKLFFETNFPNYKISRRDKTFYLTQINHEKNTNFDSSKFKKHSDSAGLIFSNDFIIRFTSSICTKPFVLLSGLSGSGKTKLAQAFAQWICKEKAQYCIVPVGADWTNREPLLGYPNALDPDDYIKPESGVLDLILQANKDENLPHFLILDEMNLSHVERYFADFLSAMESDSTIKLHAKQELLNSVPSEIKLPANLFIIGTVNIDETTYMFSPKVLDRANTIEFRINQEELATFLENPQKPDLDQLEKKGIQMAKSFVQIAKQVTPTHTESKDINPILIQFFSELKKVGSEFGYRSASEIHRLIGMLGVIDKETSLNTADKIDIAIMQKILPRLHGSRRKICPILITLGQLCLQEGNQDLNIESGIFDKEDFNFNDDKVVRYPISLEKMSRMYNGAIDNGFTSYAEA